MVWRPVINRATVEFTEEEIRQSIPARFERVAQHGPDRLAIKMGDRRLTYGELNRHANRIACAIKDKLGSEVEPIALLFEHGIDAVAAILGALKAGKFFVALDVSVQRQRNNHILEDLLARSILTDNRSSSLVPALTHREPVLINIDAIDESCTGDDLGSSVASKNLAMIQYSSGSTGEPKGVVQTHENILHSVLLHSRRAQICPEDRLTLLHSLSAAAAYGQLFTALLNGASLFPFDVRSLGVHQLAQWLREEKITVYHSTPVVFRQLGDVVSEQSKLVSLRLIHLGGAPITRSDFDVYRQISSPGALLEIGMGSAEGGGICSAQVNHSFSFPKEGSPIGYPRHDKKILLLDDNGREVKAGEAGEIAVKSRHLKPGYWRKPELSRASYSSDPSGGEERVYRTGDLGRMMPDGFFVFLGRKDLMVKIRGFTVQIGEIENTLLNHQEVKSAAVVAWDKEPGEKYLAAYVVVRSGQRLSTSALQEFLRAKLPEYMVPSAFVFLQRLPQTNGKIDRRALPLPDRTRPNLDQPYAPPKSITEQRLAVIWEEVLDVRPIGIHDNFFDLGGHSLAATRVVSQVIKTFQLELPLQLLFRSPTVAEMAAVITQSQAKKLDQGDLNRILTELESLSEEQAQQAVAQASVENVEESRK
jgi:amino acid adenylation domain-containing protein